MNTNAATALVVKMEDAWPTPKWSQAKIAMWVEDLELLEEAAAGTAFVQLRRDRKDCPTYSELRTAAKSLNHHDASTGYTCLVCDGNGWYTPHENCEYVLPCECEHGEGPRRVHAKYRAERARAVRVGGGHEKGIQK